MTKKNDIGYCENCKAEIIAGEFLEKKCCPHCSSNKGFYAYYIKKNGKLKNVKEQD